MFPQNWQGRSAAGANPNSISPLSVTVVDKCSFPDTKGNKNKISTEKCQPHVETVQSQMSIACAAFVIQITSFLYFALGCGRQKNLGNGFHLPPNKTNHANIGSTHCFGWHIWILQTSSVSGGGIRLMPLYYPCGPVTLFITQ